MRPEQEFGKIAEAAAKAGATHDVASLVEFLKKLYDPATQKGKAEILKRKQEATRIFANSLEDNARVRREARNEARKNKFPARNPSEIDPILESTTKAAKEIGSRTDIVKNVDTAKHAVTKELAARIAALPPKLQQEPRVLFVEAARAYNSIDFQHLNDQEALEIKTAIEDVFDCMRQQPRPPDEVSEPIPDNDELWYGLGDYYLSAEPPQGGTPEQQAALKKRLRLIQTSTSEGDPQKRELENLNGNHEKLIDEIDDDALPTKEAKELRERLAQEIKDLEERGGGRGERAEYAGNAAYEYEQEAKTARTLGLKYHGLLHEIVSDKNPDNARSVENAFPGKKAVQAELLRIANLFCTQGAQASINSIPASALSVAESSLTNLLRDNSLNLSSAQKDVISGYLSEIRNAEYKLREEDRGESRIQLSKDDWDLLKKAPLALAVKVVMRAANEMMVDQTSPMGKQSLDRLENILYTLFGEGFDRNRLKLAVGENVLSNKEISDLRGDIGKKLNESQKKKFSEALVTQWHALRFLEAKSNAPNAADKDFQRVVNSLNDEDYFGMDGIYGELIARIRTQVRARYVYYAAKENGLPAAHDPKYWDMAIQETAKAIETDSELEEMFGQYLDGEYFKVKPFNPKEPSVFKAYDIDPKTIITWTDATETLTRLAAVRMVMGHEKDNMDLLFLSPGYGAAQGDYPTTFNKKFFWIAAIKAPLEHHIMQWGSLTKGLQDNDKIMYRGKSRLVRYLAPEVNEWADEAAGDLWREIEEFKRLGAAYPEEKRDYLFGQVYAKCFLIPNKDGGPPQPSKKHPEKMAAWIGTLTKKKLYEETRVFSGALIAQRYGPDVYVMMFESLFRNSHMDEFMKDAYKKVFREHPEDLDAFLKGRFLGGKIVASARGYDKAIYTKDKEKVRADHVETMAGIAHFAPHELGRVLYERQSHSFQQWCTDNVGGMAGYRDAMYNMTLYNNEIHARCDRQFLNQVDYYIGWDGMDEKQREAALVSFLKRHKGDQPKAQAAARAHVDRMQSLAKYFIDPRPVAPPPPPDTGALGRIRTALGGGRHDRIPVYGAAEELGDIRYMPILINARFDDYPYEWLQYPERLIAAAQKAGKLSSDADIEIQRVSARFFEFADQQSGPWRREERDAGGASEAQMLLSTIMNTYDEKARFKALMEAYGLVVGYQGTEAAAFWTAFEEQAVLLAEKTKLGWELFEGKQGACLISEYVNPKYKARSTDELREEWEKFIGATSGLSNNTGKSGYVAELHRAILAVTGITNWQGLLGSHHSMRRNVLEKLHLHHGVEKVLERLDELLPSGVLAFKARWLPPLLVILLLIYAASEAKKTVKGEGHG